LPDPPLLFDLGLSPIAGGISVMGTIEATIQHRCHRCLEEWVEEAVHDVAQLLTVDGDEDDDYRLDGDVYDFEMMLRDELILALPIAPLCGPDCPGLVVETGSDLNTNPSEDEAGANSPFSVLRDLLDGGE